MSCLWRLLFNFQYILGSRINWTLLKTMFNERCPSVIVSITYDYFAIVDSKSWKRDNWEWKRFAKKPLGTQMGDKYWLSSKSEFWWYAPTATQKSLDRVIDWHKSSYNKPLPLYKTCWFLGACHSENPVSVAIYCILQISVEKGGLHNQYYSMRVQDWQQSTDLRPIL